MFEKAQYIQHKDRINIKKAVVIIEGEKLPRIKVFDYEIFKKQELTPEKETSYFDKVISENELKYL